MRATDGDAPPDLLGDLRSRNLRSVQLLAADLLGRHVGGRIATTATYQETLGVGSGTVQKALSALEAGGGVTLTRHGHMGTRIESSDPGILWSFSGRGAVRVVLNPPGAIDGFGLLRGLHREFARLGVPLDVQYLQGAEDRAAMVSGGDADLTVLSESAAASLGRKRRRALRTFPLGLGTYYAPGSLVVVRRARARRDRAGRPVRVGLDERSHDHARLTRAVLPAGPRHEHVACAYPDVLTAILEDRIDTAVWHRTLLPVPLEAMGLRVDALDGRDGRDATPVPDAITSAVLVLRDHDQDLGHLLERVETTVVTAAQAALLCLDPASPELHREVWLR